MLAAERWQTPTVLEARARLNGGNVAVEAGLIKVEPTDDVTSQTLRRRGRPAYDHSVVGGAGSLLRPDRVIEDKSVLSKNERVVRRADEVVDGEQELVHVHRFGIRDENYVLVSHLEVGRQEVAARIPEVHVENDRNKLTGEPADVHPELLGELARLSPIKENRAGIRL